MKLTKLTSSLWLGNGYGNETATWAIKGAEHIHIFKHGLFWKAINTNTNKTLVRHCDSKKQVLELLKQG